MRRFRTSLALVALTALAGGTMLWANRDRAGTNEGTDAHDGIGERAREEAQEAKKRFDQPQAAEDFYALKRSPDVSAPIGGKTRVGPIDGQRLIAARAQADTLPRYDSSAGRGSPGPPANDYGGSFSALGPGNIGGRTKSIVIDPTSPTTMYAAATAGGIWKTTDGGATWAALDDFMANLAVNSLAMTPGSPQVLYAGTGEGVFNGDAVRGAGIFKTTNGGTTWTQIAATATSNFFYVNDIVVSPLDANRVYASTRTGVYRSLDAGGTWSQVLAFDAVNQNGCFDLAIRTDAGPTDRLFVACNTFAPLTIYRNFDAGGSGTWDAVYTNANFGRTSLAIAPSNQNTVYALASSIVSGSNQHGLGAVLRSTTGGASGSWTVQVDSTSPTTLNRLLLTNPPFAQSCPGFGSAAFFNQGWYDNVIAVDPADENRVWTGGIDLFRSDDGGANFGIASYWYKNPGDARKAHADQHAITFDPGYNGTTNKTMLVGDDGGIYKTLDARAATATGTSASCDATTTSATVWSSLNNGYQVTQFYDGIPYPNGATYFGGTQDNGTLRGTDGGGANAWSEVLGGDGGYVAQDPTNTNMLFAENTGLSIQKSTNGGTSFSSATTGIIEPSGNFLFITPFHMAKANPQVMFTGGAYIWRTTNQASSWVRASTFNGVRISALTTFDGDANLALVGTQTGLILRSTSALMAGSSTVWPSVQPRAGFVSSLIFDPTNTQTAYATYSTYDGGAHVWRSTDGGETWMARDGAGGTALPNIPAHSLAINPDNPSHLYLGTDLGVFVSLDEGLTWARENSGYANVATEKVVINKVGGVNTLFAFSHGRSAWRVALAAAVNSLKPPADFNGNGTSDVSVYRPSNGTWYTKGEVPDNVYYGASTDIPVPGDYNGDGSADRAVFRPSTGTWYIRGAVPDAIAYGTTGDLPVPGDYNGDGVTDIAVYRPSTGTWYIRGQVPDSIRYGTSGDIAVPGNYDGNTTTDIAVYRPSTGTWYIRGQVPDSFRFGTSGDIPVPGNYDGDTDTDLAVYRPGNGTWYVRGQIPNDAVAYGTGGDVPAPGDYNGDARTDMAVYRPGTGVWYVRGQLPDAVAEYGLSTDLPLPLPSAIRQTFFP